MEGLLPGGKCTRLIVVPGTRLQEVHAVRSRGSGSSSEVHSNHQVQSGKVHSVPYVWSGGRVSQELRMLRRSLDPRSCLRRMLNPRLCLLRTKMLGRSKAGSSLVKRRKTMEGGRRVCIKPAAQVNLEPAVGMEKSSPKGCSCC